jgi:hypothetical protein
MQVWFAMEMIWDGNEAGNMTPHVMSVHKSEEGAERVTEVYFTQSEAQAWIDGPFEVKD